MTVAAVSIGGGALLAQLLGQNLAAELLDPSKSGQRAGPAVAGSQASAPLTTSSATDTVLFSPEAQRLLQSLETAVLTDRSYPDAPTGDVMFGTFASSGQPTPTYEPPDQNYLAIDATGVGASGDMTTPTASSPLNFGISESYLHFGDDGHDTFEGESLRISRDASGTVSISLRHDESASVDKGIKYTSDTVSSTSIIVIDPSGRVSFDRTDSVSELEDEASSRKVSDVSTELKLQDTGTETVQNLTNTVEGADQSRGSDTENVFVTHVVQQANFRKYGSSQDDIALQLLTAGAPPSPTAQTAKKADAQTQSPPVLPVTSEQASL